MKQFALFVFFIVVPALSDVLADERPNIVMLFTDDQRHDAVGYAGNNAIQTPHLDRLAERGIIFENCFVNTSICAISRANLLTGQYPGRHGIDDFHKTLSESQLAATVPARLQAAGYQTAFFGKWGIGDNPEATHQGAKLFDYWAGQPMQTCFFHQASCKYTSWNGFKRPLDDLCDCPADSRGKVGYRNRIGKANLKDPLHVDSQVIPQHVKRFLEGRDESKPFCLMVFFKAPHSPFQDWDPEFSQVTKDLVMPVPVTATLANANREPAIIQNSLGGATGMRYLNNPAQHDQHLQDYYRLVTSVDAGIGRIVKSIKQHDLSDSTVVLFTSDNGHLKGEHGLAGKWLMYEPSIRVPSFIMDPRKKGGSVSGDMVLTTDFSVTMLSLAGIDAPEDMSGLDLTTHYNHEQDRWRDDFYYDHPYGHNGAIPRTVGVRGKHFVYTRYLDPEPDFEQLFDLRVDPNQLDNLAGDQQRLDRLQLMRKRCDELAAEVGK